MQLFYRKFLSKDITENFIEISLWGYSNKFLHLYLCFFVSTYYLSIASRNLCRRQSFFSKDDHVYAIVCSTLPIDIASIFSVHTSSKKSLWILVFELLGSSISLWLRVDQKCGWILGFFTAFNRSLLKVGCMLNNVKRVNDKSKFYSGLDIVMLSKLTSWG